MVGYGGGANGGSAKARGDTPATLTMACSGKHGYSFVVT